MMHRVVISGAGLLTCLGGDLEHQWHRLVSGETGIKQVDESGYPELRFLALVNESLLALPPRDRKVLKLLVRSSLLGLLAAERAIADANIGTDTIPTDRKGIYIGSGERDASIIESFHPVLMHSRAADQTLDYLKMGSEGLRYIHPNYLLSALPNSSLCQITIRHHIRGTSCTLVEDSPAGSQAVGKAFRAIRAGRADIALCGGTAGPIDASSRNTLRALGVLSACAEGPASFRPFDERHDGYIPGEGAAFLVLEDLEHARARRAHIYAEIVGFGLGTDITTPGRPDPGGAGVENAIRNALRDAQMMPETIEHITGYGSATSESDCSELNGLQRVFGSCSHELSLTAVKPVTGYMGAASDVAEVFFTACMLSSGIIPPTANYGLSDQTVDRVPLILSDMQIRACAYAISLDRNSLGCQISALALRRWDDV